ncbi:hypothetical protein BS50DRAFT_61385 [Corynespora cassiicola Philippines]|uniref:Uncharacterized protein n=1 Tax=Corynespora cassiicola Philippines TaxID=1448308 RepID=A0A2T2NJM7_CORCC|nr:hypothetical protein BS50DRAFT_61385 [Corynespora cassiicola Philippines]
MLAWTAMTGPPSSAAGSQAPRGRRSHGRHLRPVSNHNPCAALRSACSPALACSRLAGTVGAIGWVATAEREGKRAAQTAVHPSTPPRELR